MTPEFSFIPQPFTRKDTVTNQLIEAFQVLPYHISTSLPQNNNLLEEEGRVWYSQGKQRYATCLTWALINAEYSLGTEMENIEWAQALHEKTVSRQRNRGLTKAEAQDILMHYPNRDIDFFPLPLHEALLPLFAWPPIDQNDTWIPTPQQQLAITHNAKVIKNTIDQQKRLVTTILGGYNLNEINFSNPTYHAVTISGYHISKKGEMKAQVIDPTLGVLYPSLGHFSTIIVDQQEFQDPVTWVAQRR
ncbi:MAG TPA: hypothetical protein VLF89_02515 [Candidatus Saccharimonadales bacterium]|nr:hypothetical protein [Candidatus Saccharimonadales bacterium]